MIQMPKKTIDLFCNIFFTLQPPPDMMLSQWADRYRKLSKESSAEPGQWHTDKAPYQRPIMDAITNNRIQKVVIMSAAQLGKTDAFILNTIGYYIHHDPSPMLVMQPTLSMAEAFSKDRLSPMIRDTPVLSKRVNEKSRDSGNTIMQKKFAGGHITLVGANSPASIASRPIRIVLADEIDRFPATAGNEGDPLLLMEARTNTFWNKKKISMSTPTIEGLSRIEVEYENSTQGEWNMPCPQCGAMQPLEWGKIVFDKDDLDQSIGHTCEKCGAVSTETEWKSLENQGKFIEKHPNRKVKGFHMNALASPWKPWREVIEEFLKAKEELKKGNIELMKVWVNTVLGETWQEAGEEMEPDTLLKRREWYHSEVPLKVMVLTAGVDVQDDRLECEVVGWGVDKESFGIQYSKFYGSPDQDDVWNRLDSFLLRIFTRLDGVQLRISCTCVDTGGHFTQEAYRFCKGKELRRVFAIKGGHGAGKPYINKPTTSNRMKVPLFTLGVDTGKEVLLERLKVKIEAQEGFDPDTDPIGGYCHFPLEEDRHYDEDYFKALTAEKRVVRYSKGRPRFEWVMKKTGSRNEALDLRVYATAALEIYNPDLSENHALPPAVHKQHKKGVVNKGI
jgi:phage terminase large subunit GpA-like protein